MSHEVEVEHHALLLHGNVVLRRQRLELGGFDLAAQHQAQRLLAARVAEILAQDQIDQFRAEHRALLDLLAVALQADVDGLILRGADQRDAAIDQRHGGIGAHGFGQVEHALVALRQDDVSICVEQQGRKIDHIENSGNAQGNTVVEVHIFPHPFL